jgi:hypothetical protein
MLFRDSVAKRCILSPRGHKASKFHEVNLLAPTIEPYGVNFGADHINTFNKYDGYK